MRWTAAGKVEAYYRPAPGAKTVFETYPDPQSAEARLWQVFQARQTKTPLPQQVTADQVPPFAAYAQRYLDGIKPGIAYSSWKREAETVRLYLTPAFGNAPLNTLVEDVIEAYINARLSGSSEIPVAEGGRHALSPATVASHVGVLRRILKLAERAGHVPHNYARNVKRPKTPDRSVDPISPDQANLMARLIAAEFLPLLLFLLHLGLRVGEALPLTIHDWNPLRRELRIHIGLKLTPKGEPPATGPTKTRSGRRTLTVGEDLAREIIEPLVAAATNNPGNPDGLLFPSQKGTMLSASNFRNRQWTPTVVAAQLKLLSPLDRDRVLHELPERWQLLGHLLCEVQLLSLDAVRKLRREQMQGDTLHFTDQTGARHRHKLDPGTAHALGTHLAATEDVPNARGRMFPGHQGMAMPRDEFVDALRQAVDDASVRLHRQRTRLHDLRHTWAATQILDVGLTASELRHLGGWSKTSFVLDTYVELFAGQKGQRADTYKHPGAVEESGDGGADDARAAA